MITDSIKKRMEELDKQQKEINNTIVDEFDTINKILQHYSRTMLCSGENVVEVIHIYYNLQLNCIQLKTGLCLKENKSADEAVLQVVKNKKTYEFIEFLLDDAIPKFINYEKYLPDFDMNVILPQMPLEIFDCVEKAKQE